MPAEDKIHDAVVSALVKDGWTITDDPFFVSYADMDLFADLAAERVLAARRGMERIAVEIKSFLGPSLYDDLHKAVGQYQIYRLFIGMAEPERKVFLAVSKAIFDEFFTRESVKIVMEQMNLKIVIVDVPTEEVVKWIV